jgi:predicted lipoprotein with Yx(FWY)xxD motif
MKMRAFNKLITLAIVLILGVTSASFAATLSVKSKDGIGTYLVDDKGMALYMFTRDSQNMSVCGAAYGCLEKWPVFFAESVAPGASIDKTAVGNITRDDGVKQTTYKGQPLYYYFKDKDSNDVYGQGVNKTWYVVTP